MDSKLCLEGIKQRDVLSILSAPHHSESIIHFNISFVKDVCQQCEYKLI